MHYGQLAESWDESAPRARLVPRTVQPVSIVVPCHRVIGRNGTMTGYAGGVQRKEWLLRHEGYCYCENRLFVLFFAILCKKPY
jgi:methylated-DNA-[protein]-cysteine S-methyltransferase